MKAQLQTTDSSLNFRVKTTLGVAIIALIILTPFSINNFVQGRFLLGTGSLAIVAACAVNAWYCAFNRYHPSLAFWGLVPTITLFLLFALHEQGDVVIFWVYPSLLGFYFMLTERRAWLANAIFLAIIYPQAWAVLEPSYTVRFIMTSLAVSAFSAMFLRVITRQQDMLAKQASTDPLTGLSNRMLLHETLEDAIHQKQRAAIQMTLLAIDIDHFKSINDRLGHDAGDRVLQGFGQFLRQRIRSTDRAFRFGGEEFLVLLFNTDSEHGCTMAEDLRSAVETLYLIPDQHITVSIGIATLQPGETRESWMKRCDDKLYQAKSEGRNRILC